MYQMIIIAIAISRICAACALGFLHVTFRLLIPERQPLALEVPSAKGKHLCKTGRHLHVFTSVMDHQPSTTGTVSLFPILIELCTCAAKK